jgi:hypothetical protein
MTDAKSRSALNSELEHNIASIRAGMRASGPSKEEFVPIGNESQDAQNGNIPSLDVPRFVATAHAGAARMYGEQRRRLADIEATYAIDRAQLVNDYQRRMDALEQEAETALRTLHRECEAKLIEGRKLLAALAAMRGDE